jgi:ribose-phosphate pyrophosphokinase
MPTVPELFAFADTMSLARAVGARFGLGVREIEVHRFPDDESLVLAESLHPGRAIVFRSLDRPNEKLIEILFAADSLRRQGVKEIVLVTPYLGYMRQDRVFHPGEPISQKVVGGLLGRAFDHVLTVEAHLHRIHALSEVFPCRAESVSASIPIAHWLSEQGVSDLVIGPDSESEPWIRSIAHESGLEWRVASKIRYSDREVRIVLPPLPPRTRRAWIVDDITSSGATLETLIGILKARGTREVGAIVVHALLTEDTRARLARAGLDRLVSTDSIVHPTNEISLAPLLADTLSETLRSWEND